MVHRALAKAYNALNNHTKAREPAGMAARLDEANVLDLDSDRGRFEFKMMDALVLTESKDLKARQELQQQAEAGDATAHVAPAQLLFKSSPPGSATRSRERPIGLRWRKPHLALTFLVNTVSL